MSFIKRIVRAVLHFFRDLADFVLRRNLNGVRVEITCPYEFAGTPGYSQYAFFGQNLEEGAIVYSLGIGEDASFDKEIIERYGVELHAFDFTPRAIKYMEANRLPRLTFHPYGVAAKDGSLTFYAPYQAKNVSWSNIPRNTKSESFPVKRLLTIMQELDHSRIDILKMDIEGAEYEVLEDMLASGIRPAQLLVEFQHRFEGIGVGKTKKMLKILHGEGYRIFYMTEDKTEFSFLFTR
ncbi:FkbM family methyltransferase [Candidatus Parcubacteria bacterium]|nr:FkbM family methyltransferase [Candidatus Parcubacteria bacterium]